MESKGQSLRILECRMIGVVGDIFSGGLVTDDDDRPVLDDAGNQKKQWVYMLAIPKAYALAEHTGPGGKGEIFRVMQEETNQIYNGNIPQNYAWKYRDGDSQEVDNKGNLWSKREGYPGHYVLTVSSYFPPQIYDFNMQTQELKPVSSGLNCGDYYQAMVTVKAHGPLKKGKAGLYLNINGLMRYGHGQPIAVRADAGKAFAAGLPTSLPQGASATPLSPNTPQFGGQQGQANPFGGGQQQPFQGQPQVQPHTEIFNPGAFQQGQPQQGQANPFGGGQPQQPFAGQQQPFQGQQQPFNGGQQQNGFAQGAPQTQQPFNGGQPQNGFAQGAPQGQPQANPFQGQQQTQQQGFNPFAQR